METAITALLVIGVMMLAVLGISDRALTAQATLSDTTRIVQESVSERVRTIITPTNVVADPDGLLVQITLKNSGTTRLADFAYWDVFVEYAGDMSEQVNWIPPGTDVNQWSASIYQDANASVPETFDPNLLNPGEDLVITVNVSPPIAAGSTDRITVVTPNGIAVSATFTR
jgi:hypothetical protein